MNECCGSPSVSRPFHGSGCLLLTAALVVAGVTHWPSPSGAQGVSIATTPPADVTFTPGLRIQPRYILDNADDNNDFFLARVRFKGSGQAYKILKYATELKLDNVGRLARTTTAQMENGWVEFASQPLLNVRIGLYDAPFSRNALTSDSKLLVMDRSLIKDALTARGLADNTIGVLGHGRPRGGRFEYAVGVFDNLAFEDASSPTARQARALMPVARVGVNLLDPASQGGYGDYRASYVGQGRRLALAANGGWLADAHDGARRYDLYAWGGDVFWNSGPATLEAEYDHFREDAGSTPGVPSPDVDCEGWYVQGGVRTWRQLELAARYQERDADQGEFANRLRWTTVGMNVYLHDHNIKVQTDYTFKREHNVIIPNDVFQAQLQLDY